MFQAELDDDSLDADTEGEEPELDEDGNPIEKEEEDKSNLPINCKTGKPFEEDDPETTRLILL